MTRRSFSNSLPFAALATGALAQAERQPHYTSGGKSISVEWFPAAALRPDGTAPALLLLHGADGTTYADTYRFGARILAAAGYHVAFPHYLDRTDDRRVAYGRLRQDYPFWRDTVRDGFEWLGKQSTVDVDQLGIVGISLGAALAMSAAARESRVRAVVDYSGPFPEELSSISGSLPPTLVLHGEEDRIVPVSNARRLINLLSERGVTNESHFYPGQGHVFTGLARLDAASRASAFLSRHLTG